MKSYLLILLSVMGMSIFAAAFTPDIEPKLDTTPEQENIVEVNLVPEMAQKNEIEVTNLVNSVNISVPSKAVIAASNSHQSYLITKVTDSLIASPTYEDIYRTKKLVYAHNSPSLFGSLKKLRVGAVVDLTEGGVTTSYLVSGVGHFTKVPYLNGENLVECNASYTNCADDVQMGLLVNVAKGHKLALMTCDGGLNTPNRLIIYLD
jgi:hypothetical protein